MAQSDIETFLTDLLLRYDPSIDLSDGSRAQVQLVDPILARIGTDPFDSDIETFVEQRITQTFPNISIADTQVVNDVLISPMRVLLEAIVREVKLVKLRQSVANAERLGDDEVDALMANFFESRRQGGYSRGVVRIYFSAPVTVSFTLIQVASTRGGLRYTPSPAQTFTADQMLLNRDGQEYYVDVTYVAERRGDEYNVDRNEITAIANLPSAARVRNPNRFTNGLPRENSIDFISRSETKLSDRTLTVSRGIFSELTDNFPSVERIQVVGFKDPEMQRDIVKGGGMGSALAPDAFGPVYGLGTAVDDGDGNTTTHRLSSAAGHFVSRIGSAGTDPDGYFLTIAYFTPAFVMVDVAVLEVLSDTDVIIDYELPSFPLSVYWTLRRRELTISDIPGGITLPDTIDGDLVIRSGEVHIGGKTDVYLAGPISSETVAIEGISDEQPLARGGNAQTLATSDVITINDPPGGATALQSLLADGFFSIVLDEGVDAGSYDIRQTTVVGLTLEVRVPVALTGTAGNLLWKIVDEINVELTEPKDIKVEGADLVMVAGNPSVTTLSSTNFIDANVQPNDILRVDADIVGGDYTITAVGPVSLLVSPTPQRTLSNLKYMIFRPTGVVQTPVVRIKELELLDSGGAPNGVKIPYRDPVAIITRGFQNEGSGIDFEGYPASVGLVSGQLGTTMNFGVGSTLIWTFMNPLKAYDGLTSKPLTPGGFYVLTLVGVLTPAAIVAAINGDAALNERQVRASVIVYDGATYIGIYCPELVAIDIAGSANALLGFAVADRSSTNSNITIYGFNPRLGDLVEFIDGNNRGTTRVLANHVGTDLATQTVIVGKGPTDAVFNYQQGPLHEVDVLLPEVGTRIRIGHPSVGSARVYFLAPTSAEFRYLSSQFSVLVGTDTLFFRPDPENDRIIMPAPPLTALPQSGTAAFGGVNTAFRDTSVDFTALNVRPGDILDVLFFPIISTSPLPSPGTIAAIVGKTLILRLDESPWITINFPIALSREDLVDYINSEVGENIASINGTGNLVLLAASSLVTIREDSTILSPDTLFLAGAPRSTAHPYSASAGLGLGTYIIRVVGKNDLVLSPATPLPDVIAYPFTAYRIRRNLQRISSTEMNNNQDETQLYYVDVEMLSLTPGDRNNAPSALVMTGTGVVADGYRLYSPNNNLTYSRAERLFAEMSRNILLVGSSDSPEEYVQLSRQNVQVSYDRSQLVDDVQSFFDSDLHRVTNEEMLARHLLPHYVNLGWRYVAGDTEIVMRQAIATALSTVEANEELEVIDLSRVMTARGTTSVYSLDPESPSGRSAPVMVVVYHDIERNIRAVIVNDFVKTSRTQRFIADNLAIVRVAPGSLR